MTADRRSRIADLHAHTTASDGLNSPAALVSMAKARGISILAVTDHDTIGGISEATCTARELGIRLIPGIEFSTRARRGETHVLGYGIDVTDAELARELAELRASRLERGSRMIGRLEELGIELDRASMRGTGADGSPGRPHIARALVESGHAGSVSDAFERYLSVGRPAFVPRRAVTAERAIELVSNAGGIAVLAHPLSVFDLDQRLGELIDAGLRGIEAYYGEYDDSARDELARLAESRDLLVTGGSDFHGSDEQEGRELGAVSWPALHLDAFLDALG
jgi:hypothetical protein